MVDLTKAEKPLTLYQTLGYKNVIRNKLADQAAKEAVQYTSRVDLISLLYTKKRIQKKYKLKPLNPLILRGKRSLVVRYLQLKLGHAIVETYLQRIKVEELAKCQWYSKRKQSLEHLLFSYKKQKEPRKSLLKELEEYLGTYPRKRHLKRLFLDMYIPEFLQFLQDTQVNIRGSNRVEENQVDIQDIQLLDLGEG